MNKCVRGIFLSSWEFLWSRTWEFGKRKLESLPHFTFTFVFCILQFPVCWQVSNVQLLWLCSVQRYASIKSTIGDLWESFENCWIRYVAKVCYFFLELIDYWIGLAKQTYPKSVAHVHMGCKQHSTVQKSTSSSAIAERPRCRVG